MATRRLLLVGFGPVGRAFAKLVLDRQASDDPEIVVAGVSTSRGTWVAEPGTNADSLRELLGTAVAGEPLHRVPGWRAGMDGASALEAIESDVLVEAGPTELSTGEPSAGLIRAGLERGLHVITASKGGLLVHGPELIRLARGNARELRYGAAVGAALPSLEVATRGLAGSRVERIEAVLNGTSNFLLTRMRTDGIPYATALREAQAAGIAEADPRLDVGGWDTAAKLVLVANAVWGADLRLADVEVRGIEEVTVEDVGAATRDGGRLRLVGSAWPEEGRVRARVLPQRLDPGHPLAAVDGAEKGITFSTTTLGRITVSGGASSPVGAAAALLRDLLAIEG